MKIKNHSVHKTAFIHAAILILSMMALHAETIAVPAGTALALRVGIDENSYTLQGNWGEPPEGGDAKLVASAEGDTTVTGSIAVNLFDHILCMPGVALTIDGGISSGGAASSYLILEPAEGSTITIRKNPITLPRGLDGLILFGDPTHQGTVILNVADNSWGGAIIQEGATLQTTVASALAPDGTLMVHGILDLNGKDHTVGTLADDLKGGASPGSTTGRITSTSPATLTVHQTDVSFPGEGGAMKTSKGNFSGSLTGAVSLIKQGPGTLNLGGNIDTSGNITVEEGTLGLSGTLKAHSLNVAKGSRLAVQINGKTPVLVAGDLSIAGSDLDLTTSSPQSSAGNALLFLIVNNSRGAAPAPFQSVSVDGTPADPNSILFKGQKFRLVYNANFNASGSDGLANDIALVPLR